MEILIASLVIGNLINWLLHGALTVQLYLYYLAFPDDKTWTKAAVYTVYILETIQTIGLATILLLVILGNSPRPGPTFHFYSYWLIPDRAWAAQALLIDFVGGLVPLIVQCVYAQRIQIILQRKDIPRLIIVLAILQFCAAILTAMYQFTIPFVAWTGLDILNDLIIAFIMVRSLSKYEPLSENGKLKLIRLIRLIIATGSLTVAANCLSLVCVLSSIGGTVGMPILVFMPKLYANSILVMQNNRMSIKNSRNATSNTSTNVVSMLVIADHQIGPSGSAMSRGEVPFSATTSSV